MSVCGGSTTTSLKRQLGAYPTITVWGLKLLLINRVQITLLRLTSIASFLCCSQGGNPENHRAPSAQDRILSAAI